MKSHRLPRRLALSLLALSLASRAAAPLADSGVVTAPVPGLEFVFEETVTLAPTVDVGTTPYGVRRRVPITGGTFEGPHIRGKVLSGGADWQLRRPDGYTILEADYMLQTDDGTLIHIYNKGLSHSADPSPATRYIRTSPFFEAPNGSYEWLNEAMFVGTLEAITSLPTPAVRIRIYKVT